MNSDSTADKTTTIEEHLRALRQWDTPTVYNGWELITNRDAALKQFNRAPIRSYMPDNEPLVGYAVTVEIQPSMKSSRTRWADYRHYVASEARPKVVVVKDLDAPDFVGAFWGEVNATIHQALGCVGTITEGCVRDLDAMRSVGFNALASGTCVGHAHSAPLRWGKSLEVFGCEVNPGDLIHADQHGFLAIPLEDQDRVLQATEYMDANERGTLIHAARTVDASNSDDYIAEIGRAGRKFRDGIARFGMPQG